MHIFHIAEASRWQAAKLSGSYAQSTLGRTLDEEGFIHAAREDQWEDVRRRYYAGVREPLLLLVIDTAKLTSPWQEDVVGDTTYPHIYGPLNPAAVVTAVPLPADAEAPVEAQPVPVPAAATAPPAAEPSASFTELFFGEMVFRMGAALLVMAFTVVLSVVGLSVAGGAGRAVGILVGLVVGGVVAFRWTRRRGARLDAAHPH